MGLNVNNAQGYPGYSTYRPPSAGPQPTTAPSTYGPGAGVGGAVGGALNSYLKPPKLTTLGGFKAPGTGNQTPPTGTQSGPGLLEQWFDQRANGTDPGYEYSLGRNTAMINRESAARGGFNSSATMNSLANMYAGMATQREGQLDQLAAGASGERAGNLAQMFNTGLGIAGGEAGTALPYNMAAGGAMNTAAADAYQSNLIKNGVDPAVAAQRTKDIFGALSLGVQSYTALGKTGGGAPTGGGPGGGLSNPYTSLGDASFVPPGSTD